jgi:hypothetical protein
MNYGFDANSVPDSDPGDDFGPIPPGIYDAEIEAIEIKQTNAGTGEYFNFRWRIQGPTHAGRVHFEIVNWSNPSAKAQEIGRKQLAKASKAVNRPRFNHPNELVGGRCRLRLIVRDEKEFGKSNRVAGYIPHGEGGAVAPRPSAPAPTTNFGSDDVPF